MPSAAGASGVSGRVLLVGWDGGGNVPPLIALGKRLLARGRKVCVLAPGSLEQRVRAGGLDYRPFEREPSWSPRPGRAAEDEAEQLFATHLAGLDFAHELLDAADELKPATLVVDAMATAALSAAELLPIPTATLVHTRYQFFASERGAPVWEPEHVALNDTRARLGLSPIPAEDGWSTLLWQGADLAMIASLPELEGPGPRLLPHASHVGPILDPHPEPLPQEIEAFTRKADRPLVVASLSTTYMHHEDLTARIVNALNTTTMRSVITLGRSLEQSVVVPPTNGIVASWAPHERLLPAAAAVVTHAGLGTILAALSAGVPVVCLPLGRDQPDNAAQIARLGAGIALPPNADPATISQAVTKVISTPAYRHAAHQLAQRAAALGHGEQAATAIERLAAAGRRDAIAV